MPFLKPVKRISLFDATDLGHSFVEWYIIFTDTNQRHWWQPLLKNGYFHIIAAATDGFNWFCFNPNLAFYEIGITNHRPDQTIYEVAPDIVDDLTIYSILRIEASRRVKTRVPWIFSPATCTEAIKALLGIDKFWLFTPWQLYNYLVSVDNPLIRTEVLHD